MGEPILTRSALAATMLLLAFLPVGGRAQTPADEPFRVDRIELRVDAPPGRTVDLKDSLQLEVGKVADERAVRRTLDNLFSTGVVAGAEVLARTENDGSTTAVVVIRTHTWVERVELTGELGRPKSELLRLIPQRALNPLFEDRVLRGVFALQDELARHGYRDARVRVRVEPAEASLLSTISGTDPLARDAKRVVVRYEIAAGPRAVLKEIRFEGDLGVLAPEKLSSALASGPGKPFDRNRVLSDPERLRSKLAADGFLAARVDRIRLEWLPPAELVLVVPVEVGPRYEVQLTGIEKRKARKVLPFLRGDPWEESQNPRLERKLLRQLQESGHWKARAEIRGDQKGTDEAVLTVEVDQGPRYRVDEVRILGHEQLRETELAARMTTGPANPVLPGSGRLVDEVLAEDLANLRSFVALSGFYEAKIGPAKVIEGEDRDLIVEIPIVEGLRRRVVDLELRGVDSFPAEDLRALLPLQAGGPFHPILVDDTVNTIRAFYEEKGFPLVAVAPSTDWSPDQTLVDVDLRVEEGPRRILDRVLIRGHQRTRTAVLRRAVPLKTGEPVSRFDLLKAERELYRLGVFSRVDVDVTPSTELDERRDVLVRVDEGRRFRLAYGVSYHSEDGVGGLFSASASNVLGRADRIQLDLRSTANESRLRLAYSQPQIGKLAIPFTFSIYRQEDDRESFRVDDRGLQIGLTREQWRGVRFGVSADYHIVDLSEETTDPLEIEPEDREIKIASLTSTLLVDRRDDPLDARRGWSATVQVERAAPFLDADADFSKVFWQNTGIVGLGPFGRLVGSVRLGAIEPEGLEIDPDPVVPTGLPSALIPISERFFAGGRTTHRAYERDSLGVVGETLIARGDDFVEIGGNGLALLNLDWRFPIVGAFGGTVFVDAGNVWADWRDIDPSEFELGFGIGARYLSPIGPVRFEIGWKFEPLPGARNPVFLLSVGNPF